MKGFKLLLAVAVTLGMVACSKKDGGGGSKKATTPGSCYNYNAQYGNYQYQWVNNFCVDTKSNNKQVDPKHCNTGTNNQNYNNQYYNNQYNNNYGYNYGYNNGYGYNNNNYQSYRYHYSGNTCIDSYNGQTVAASYCQNSYNNCDGYAPGVYPINGAYQANACSAWDTAYVKYYPVTYPNTGQTVCVGYQVISQFTNYWGYQPMYMNNGSIQGCRVGSSSCNCMNAGGTIGWVSAGIEMGICAY